MVGARVLYLYSGDFSVVKGDDDWQDGVANRRAGRLWRHVQSPRGFAARASFRGKVGFGAWRSAPLLPISWNKTTKTSARATPRPIHWIPRAYHSGLKGDLGVSGAFTLTPGGLSASWIWSVCLGVFFSFLLKPDKLPERAARELCAVTSGSFRLFL